MSVSDGVCNGNGKEDVVVVLVVVIVVVVVVPRRSCSFMISTLPVDLMDASPNSGCHRLFITSNFFPIHLSAYLSSDSQPHSLPGLDYRLVGPSGVSTMLPEAY